MPLDFEIDKLSHSIEDAVTGKSFLTTVLPFDKIDLQRVSKKEGWKFSWKTEFSNPQKRIFKLVIEHQADVIHGLVSLNVKTGYIEIHLVENAPFNIGKNKMYQGVAGNLVAYACKLSFEHGFDGNVLFFAKTKLIAHYEQSLGAVHVGGQRMIIYTREAAILVNKYFPEFHIKNNGYGINL
ncbi:MAG: hypothetical protein LBB79_02040 [Prevotellaceae bacterium]|jgi:hypothetical protein|nr:hypothetical protein [Prevotellaceae bacterium]